MNLSPHFTLEELIMSTTAVRLGIDNTPSVNIRDTLSHLVHPLEEVRRIVGPMHINSGYRCLELNRALKSSDTSQHVKGQAIDFTVAGKTPFEVCRLIEESDIKFDQLIHEFDSWTHVSFCWGTTPRGSVLTIDSAGTRLGLV